MGTTLGKVIDDHRVKGRRRSVEQPPILSVATDLRAQAVALDAEDLLHECGITVNRNAVPFDPRPPMVTSGLRLGTPALTTRGMKEDQMRQVADLLDRVMGASGDDAACKAVREDVRELCARFPLWH